MAENGTISLNGWYREGRKDANKQKEKWTPLYGWSEKTNEEAYAKGWNEEMMLKLLEGR